MCLYPANSKTTKGFSGLDFFLHGRAQEGSQRLLSASLHINHLNSSLFFIKRIKIWSGISMDFPPTHFVPKGNSSLVPTLLILGEINEVLSILSLKVVSVTNSYQHPQRLANLQLMTLVIAPHRLPNSCIVKETFLLRKILSFSKNC